MGSFVSRVAKVSVITAGKKAGAAGAVAVGFGAGALGCVGTKDIETTLKLAFIGASVGGIGGGCLGIVCAAAVRKPLVFTASVAAAGFAANESMSGFYRDNGGRFGG